MSLFLDRKAAAREIGERHGLVPTPEDSFRAQISIMCNHSGFRDRAEQLWAAFHLAEPEKRQQIMDQAAELVGDCQRAMYGDEVVDALAERSPYANMGTIVGGEGVFEKYAHEVRLEDISHLQEWKIEIDKIVERIHGVLGGSQDSEHYHRIVEVIGAQPEEKHIIRFAIAVFVSNQSARWRPVGTPLRAAWNMVFPSLQSVSKLGDRYDFCADLAIVGKILSDEYGFRAEIKGGDESLGASGMRLVSAAWRFRFWEQLKLELSRTDKAYHQYLEFLDDGAIFDPIFLPHLSGYLMNGERYEEELG
jgi:hypothetical protein